MSNPAAAPCIVEDREGDGRWMSMVMSECLFNGVLSWHRV